jgi:small subunit ribosomal protein S17
MVSGMGETVVAGGGVDRNPRRVAVGTVIGDKREKTISVEVKKLSKHPRYGKYVYRSLICHAHDERNEARMGDRVEIQETRPLSKQKRWRLTRIVERAAAEESLPVTETMEPK